MPSRQTGPVTSTERRPDRFEAVLVLVLYVVPLTATVVVLAWLGLPGLALALLAVEAGVSAAVVRAKRPEGAPSGWLVPALCVVAVAAAVGAALLLPRG